ncbi:MAG TPA: acyltransferase [Azospirillaceae bacterium]|nr:acyltransferase [Azospirillaceae bacterium]
MASADKERIDGLTGLRAVAALWVVLYHLREVGDDRFLDLGPFDTLVRFGFLGVELFFVLSGFILMHVYRETFSDSLRGGDWANFLWLRVARLYPVHLVTLGMMLALYLAGLTLFKVVPNNAYAYTPVSLLHNLAMTHAWFPGVGSPNTPAWSISAEWFGYLLFPVLAMAVARSDRTLQAAMLVLSLVLAQALGDAHVLMRFITAFILGITLFELSRDRASESPLGPAGSLLIAGALVASLYVIGDVVPALHVGLFGLLIVALRTPADWGARALSRPLMVYLGEVSYSVYMVHWFVWSAVKRGGPKVGIDPASPLVQVAALAGILLLAVATYHLVEIPGRRWLRRATPAVLVPRRAQAE